MIKPMRAATCEDVKLIKFPCWASPKLDGIRCLIVDGVPLSKTFKPFPNKATAAHFSDSRLNGIDGELVVGSPYAKDVYNKTESGVMSEDGDPQATLYIFDYFKTPNDPYGRRLDYMGAMYAAYYNCPFRIEMVPVVLCDTLEDLLVYETQILDLGYEGVMVRSMDGEYKFGKATVKEGTLLKLKRFADSEAEIIGFIEGLQNNNVATKDVFGRTKRSSHKANKVPNGTLGSFMARDIHTGVEFDMATGVLTADQKQDIFNNKEEYLNKIAVYKHFPRGVKIKPRYPGFKGWRDMMDIIVDIPQ